MPQRRETQEQGDQAASSTDRTAENLPDTSLPVYSPLSNPAREGRLLVLTSEFSSYHLNKSPLNQHSIGCTLEHVPLSLLSNFNYEALSYTWAGLEDGDGVKEIYLGNHQVKVGRNLYYALYYLRHNTESRLLWIDALCIDQSNVGERNHQVRQMSQIYSKASKVLIWLGMESDSAAFDFITNQDAAFLGTQALGQHYRRRTKNATGIVSFFRMCERQYWSRLWVVQEIVLAKELMVHWGSRVTTWTAFSRALQQYQTYSRITNSLPYLFDRQRNDHYYECRLLKLLEACQASKCTDPRDKVYGLLGLANDCGPGDLEVDYSKTLYEIYKDVMMFHSCRAHAKRSWQDRLSRRDLDVVRFSQMFQSSFQTLGENCHIYPGAVSTNLQPAHNHGQTNLIMATGVFAGRIAKVEHPGFERVFTPLIEPVLNLAVVSIPAVDVSPFDDSQDLPGGTPLDSSGSHGENQLENILELELGYPESESDATDWKAKLDDILFSKGAVSSTISSLTAKSRSQHTTAIETLLSRFPGFPTKDLEKAVDISCKRSYICCKCAKTSEAPPSRPESPLGNSNKGQNRAYSALKSTHQSTGRSTDNLFLHSEKAISPEQKETKETGDTFDETMCSVRSIPTPKAQMPSIITYAPIIHSPLGVNGDFSEPVLSIGPPSAREGDIILQFIDCNVAAVIRPIQPFLGAISDHDPGCVGAHESGYYELVGRALLLYGKSDRSKGKNLFPSHKALDNVKLQFECHLDIERLWALTR